MVSNEIFKLKNPFSPAGDQPVAISKLVEGFNNGFKKQTLLGVTGSGKTFTIANVINQIQKPTLIIAHNKTLAAQLAQEYREFFPDNAVHYFVSYYDYYQPEAYKPVTDTYIEKDASINEEIDRLRHASTQALLTRKDVIIVASVSCIYGLGSPAEYLDSHLRIQKGELISRRELMEKLISVYYERTNADLSSGQFRAIGNRLEIMPVSDTLIYLLTFLGNEVAQIDIVDRISGRISKNDVADIFIFPAKHFVTNQDKVETALKNIEIELNEQLLKFEKEGKLLEAERLKRRTTYDLAMIREMGYTNGIENYSRHLSFKKAGEPPETLISYFPHDKLGNPDFLTVIDESHVTLPQLNAMYNGDQARKNTLVEYGFRLPSAKDNRPLRFEEFETKVGQQIYVSATPSEYEKTSSLQIVEQIIRPTGLIDPVLEIRGVIEKDNYQGQISNFIAEAIVEIKRGGRVLATTLTKKMAEDLSNYLKEQGIKTEYLHSDVKTIDRIKIITEFRKGNFDCLVGVNLLREGLDMPEVSLIGILDADKEGFLRSETSLIQTIGRAARNIDGRVILYADSITGSMKRAIDETNRRRQLQMEYNQKHNITPQTIKKAIHDITDQLKSEHEKAVNLNLLLDQALLKSNPKQLIKQKEAEMADAVEILDFETAAIIRDELLMIKKKLGIKEKKK